MNKTIGFIGCGNMAQAMIGGIVKSGLVEAERVIASNMHPEKLEKISDEYGIEISRNNKMVAESADIIILAVKPNMYSAVINEIKGNIKPEVTIVSIAAGITIEFIEKAFEKSIKVVRTMPNTPALVGEGMSAICHNINVKSEDLEEVLAIFESFGKVELIDEKLMDAIPAVSGSSPAYVYMFIEALADGAVLDGIPREKAYKLAAQSVLGAAKMVMETGMHPGALKDSVCSPGGTTIEAVYTLEKNNFRGSIISAMQSCTNKTKLMSNSNK